MAISHVNSTTAWTGANVTTIDVGVPSSIDDDDVLFAFIAKDDDPAATPDESGWTEIAASGETTGDDCWSGCWYRVVTDAASEPSTYGFSGDSERYVGSIMALRGVHLTDTIDSVTPSYQYQQNDTTPTAAGVSTNTDDAWICAFFGVGHQTNTTSGGTNTYDTPSGMTERADICSSGGNAGAALGMFTELRASSGASGDRTSGQTVDVTGRDHLCRMFAIRPAGAATTPIGESLALDYDMAQLAGESTELDYDIFNIIGESLAVDYDILSTIGESTALDWDIFALAGESLAIDYDMAQLAGESLALDWDIFNIIGESLAIDWGILDIIGESISLQWDILGLAGESVALDWDIHGLAGESLEIVYDMSGSVGESLALDYDLFSLIGESTSLPYDILAIIGESLAAQYDIYGLAGESLAADYDINVLAGESLAIVYDILAAAGVIGESLALQYDIRNLAGESLALDYDILSTVAESLALPYDILALAAESLSVTYDMSQLAGESLAIVYDMAGVVGESLAIDYGILNQIAESLSIPYDILTLAAESLALTYDMRALAGESLAADWDIRGLATDTLAIVYDIEGLTGIVGESVALVYDIEALPTDREADLMASKYQAIDGLRERLKIINGGTEYHFDLGRRVYSKLILPNEDGKRSYPYLCVPLIEEAQVYVTVEETWIHTTWQQIIYGFVGETTPGKISAATVDAISKLHDDIIKALMYDWTLGGVVGMDTKVLGNMSWAGAGDEENYGELQMVVQLSIRFSRDELGP